MARKIKKCKKKHDQIEEATWIYSYADMMSLITCFFILFYSVSTSSGQLAEDVVESILQSFNKESQTQTSSSLVGFNNSINNELRAIHLLLAVLNLGDQKEEFLSKVDDVQKRSKDLESAKEILKEEMKEELSDEKIKDAKNLSNLVERENTLEVVLPIMNLFVGETTKFTEQGRKQLIKIARSLEKVTKLSKFIISGHTSHLPPKNSVYKSNWELSSARAGVVAELFIKRGINPDFIEAKGLADVRPLYPEKDTKGKYIKDNVEKNSRIEITLVKRSAVN